MAFTDPENDDVMNDINMTPLIDVMLVLLIVFMVTLPVMTNAVKLELPTASSTPNDTKPPHISLSIDASGLVHWDDKPLTSEELHDQLMNAAAQNPQPEVQLYADRDVRYEAVADLLAESQKAGLTKIDFVTIPKGK